jgi:aminoglycoside/choline kinase family phosphotransferase
MQTSSLVENSNRAYMLVSNVGATDFFTSVSKDKTKIDIYYKQALDKLHKMHNVDRSHLACYTEEKLIVEMDLFEQWFVPFLANNDKDLINAYRPIRDKILENITQQKHTFVHRDYHSRNLIHNKDEMLYTIDFQDGVSGPITYDLVSLLKDCYIDLGKEKQEELFDYFYSKVPKKLQKTKQDFYKDFLLMGMQRHLKVAGIFVRLYIRDGKDGYLSDIELCLRYLLDACYELEFSKDFAKLLKPYVDNISTAIKTLKANNN